MLNYVSINLVTKRHKTVSIFMVVATTGTIPSATAIATIPLGYRPSSPMVRVPACSRNSGNGATNICFVHIDILGQISLDTATVAGHNELDFNITYTVD